MKRALRLAGLCIAVLLTAYFVWSAAAIVDERTIAQLANPHVLAAVALAAALSALVIPLSALAWMRLLRAQGERWQPRALIRIMGLAQLAKYIPGNIAQHASRVALCLRAGMSMRALAVSVTQETVLAVSASLIVGVLMLAASTSGLTQLPKDSRLPLAVAGSLLSIAVLLFCLFDLPSSRLATHPSRWMRMLGRLGGLPGPATTLPSLGLYALNYILIGIGLWGVASAAGLPASAGYALITATFALSWVLGFLAPGTPAGLGVREGIMLLLLKGTAPEQALLLFVVLARVVTVLGDVACFVAASFIPAHELRTPEEAK